MKNYIKYIFILFISFVLYNNNVMAQSMYLTIDNNGATCTNGCSDDLDSWYKYEDDTLYLYRIEDNVNYDNFYKININKDTEIVASPGVRVKQIYTSADIYLSTTTKDETSYIDYIEGVNGTEELYINEANITLYSGLQYLEKITINKSIVDHREGHGGGVIKPYYSYTNFWTDSGYGQVNNKDGMSLKIYDSTVYANQVLVSGEDFVLENSTFYINDYLAVYKPTGSINNSNIYTWDSGNQPNGTPRITFGISSISGGWTFNDTHIDGLNLINQLHYQKNKYTFNNSTYNGKEIDYCNLVTNDSTINTTTIKQGSLKAVNSQIVGSGGFSFIDLYNSSFKSEKTDPTSIYNYYPTDLEYDDYTIKAVNSSIEFAGKVYTYNTYIENSDAKFKILSFDAYDSTGVYTNKYNFYAKNSTVTTDDLETYGNITLDNTKMTSSKILIQDNDRNGVPDGDLILRKSKLYVNNTADNSTGVTINDLTFENSHLIAKGTTNAWDSKVDITIHNLVGINENEIIMDMNPNGNNYSFYDNGEISKYVEIRTPLKVTFKVVNGTWSNGSTDDIDVDSYMFGTLKNTDVPTNMKANDGYKSGSWDKTISYNELEDEVTYTYTFVQDDAPEDTPAEDPKDDTPDKKPDPEKEPEKEPELKNPETGAFVSFTAMGSLSFGCIKSLLYAKTKKVFRRI